MEKEFKCIVIFYIIAVLFTSCKSVTVLPTKTPVKNVNIEALTSKISTYYPKVDKLRSRIKATYDNGEQRQEVIIQFRMENKKRIWLSATMIIPIAKLLISPKEILFYEKFQKTYFKGNFDIINKPLKTNFNYFDIENFFLGKPLSNPTEGKWKQISNPQYYILIPQAKGNQLRPTLFFDPTTFLLKEQRFIIPGSTQSITIKYLRHLRIEGKFLPSLIEVILLNGTESQRLQLEFSRTDFTKGISFPFEIPPGYKKIQF